MTHRAWISLIGATLMGSVLRLWHLGSASLWLDEAYTYYFVTGTLRQGLLALLDIGNHPPVYYLISRAMTVLGTSEFSLRLPAALAGIVAIPLTYQFARRWQGPSAGHWTAWWMALNPLVIWYSQDARPNTLHLCWALVLGWSFMGVRQRPTQARWATYVAASGLAYLTHYFATLFALASAVYVIHHLRREPLFFRQWVLAQLTAAALISPWFIAWGLHPVHSFGVGWIPQPNPGDLPLTILNLVTGWNEQGSFWVWALAAVWLVTSWRYFQTAPAPFHREFTLLWVSLPLAAIYVFSLRRPLYIDRYFLIVLPPLLLWAGAGLSRMPARWQIGLGLSLLVCSLGAYPATAVKEDWRGVAGFLRERLAAGETVELLDVQDLLPLHYYGVKLKVTDQTDLQWPKAFWTVGRDTRESAHRFSEYQPAQWPPAFAGWRAAHGYAIQTDLEYTGVRIVFIQREEMP